MTKLKSKSAKKISSKADQAIKLELIKAGVHKDAMGLLENPRVALNKLMDLIKYD